MRFGRAILRVLVLMRTSSRCYAFAVRTHSGHPEHGESGHPVRGMTTFALEEGAARASRPRIRIALFNEPYAERAESAGSNVIH